MGLNMCLNCVEKGTGAGQGKAIPKEEMIEASITFGR
jgi:hypothetical protein